VARLVRRLQHALRDLWRAAVGPPPMRLAPVPVRTVAPRPRRRA
jgi:hypothetical protein